MTNKTTSDDDESDDEQVDIRAVLAWLKATLLTYLGRARSAVEQSIDEVAPQLRGTFSGVSVPSGALKPLALAAVLLFAAFAMPAAPFGADPAANGSDPVTGTTYDALGDSEFHDVVADRLDSAEPEAPPAPETVRASAGSQTMSVETTIRDGEPAIVLEDDRTHEGRWVAIETSWFQEQLGEVPQVAHIQHETEGSYTSPIQARGGEAAFYVEEFSQNTITFEGELTVTADPATDGDSITYEAPNGGDDLSINVTGVINKQNREVTGSRVSPDTSRDLSVGGNIEPTDGSGGDPVLSVTAYGAGYSIGNAPQTNSYTASEAGYAHAISLSESGDRMFVLDYDSATLYSYDLSTKWDISTATYDKSLSLTGQARGMAFSPDGETLLTVIYDNSGDNTVNQYSLSTGWDISTATHEKESPLPETVALSGVSWGSNGDSVYFSDNQDLEILSYTTGSVYDVGSLTYQSSLDVSATVGNPGDVRVTNSGETMVIPNADTGEVHAYELSTDWDVTTASQTKTLATGGSDYLEGVAFGSNGKYLYTQPTAGGDTLQFVTKGATPSVSVSDGNGNTHEFSGFSDGETKTTKLDIKTTSNLDFSSNDGGSIDYTLNMTERTETVDPVVELNGNAASYSGTLSEGETVSVDANDSWITEGTNTIDVAVGDGSLPAGSPVPQVGLEVEHDVSESRTIDYSAEAFSERYSVSKTWAENTSNATLTIPWASDNVVAMRDLNVEYRDGGVEPSPRPTPSYKFVDGSVVVELGDVEAGWNTTVEADGSKVQVDGADLEVVEPTDQGEDLNTTVRLNNPSDDVYIGVGATDQGEQLHYLANASWSNEESSRITASGTNELRIPDAPDNGEANLRTLPLAFDVNSGAVDVDVPDGRLDESEPVYRIGPGDQVGDSYDVTFVEAEDAQPYVLYDETDEIVLDQGLASSPLTLSATEPEEPHVVQFREDDGTVSSSGGGGLSGTGGVGPMVTNPRPFSALGDLVPGPGVIVALLAGLVGLTVVSRRTGLFDEGTRSDAVADATRDVGSRLAGLVGQVLRNELVVAALLLGAGVWLLSTGVFTASERLIVALGSVPIAMFLVLRQFDAFDIRVWAGSTAVIGFLGAQRLAPEVFATVAEEAGIFVVVGVVLLGWRALSAWREEASTPDQVTRLEISAEENEDD